VTKHGKVVLDRDDLRRTLVRIAHEIVEGNPGRNRLGLVGIHTRGAVLASRLHALVGELSGSEVPLGDLDISFYRDDVQVRGGEAPLHPQPLVRATRLDFPLAEDDQRELRLILRSFYDQQLGIRFRSSSRMTPCMADASDGVAFFPVPIAQTGSYAIRIVATSWG